MAELGRNNNFPGDKGEESISPTPKIKNNKFIWVIHFISAFKGYYWLKVILTCHRHDFLIFELKDDKNTACKFFLWEKTHLIVRLEVPVGV